MPKRRSQGLALTVMGMLILCLVTMDQWTKSAVVASFEYAKAYHYLPFLNIRLIYNRGASFGWLADQGGWQVYFFSVIALLVVFVLLIWQQCARNYGRLHAVGVCLIVSGALGNLIDRMRLGYVVDFIDLHYANWHFATFNMADAAITLGAAAMVVALWRYSPPRA